MDRKRGEGSGRKTKREDIVKIERKEEKKKREEKIKI
jgi:hypothetical protein